MTNVYPAGTEVTCPFCRRVLYRLTADLAMSDLIVPSIVEQVDGVHAPATGIVIECPEHGAVHPNMIAPV